MSQSDRVEMHFSGGADVPDLKSYRPISPLVIVACVAGLASLLAIVHPLLWIVPVVAVVLAACAIRQVSSRQSRYSGRLAAIAALSVATLVGTYAPARLISLERELHQRARQQAEDWLSLIQQGRYEELHQFTLEPTARFKGPGTLAEHYLPPTKSSESNANSTDPAAMDPADMMPAPSAGDNLAAFLLEPVMARLVEYGETCSVEHVANVSIATVYGNFEVTQRFRASGVHDGQPESVEFLMTSTRWESLGHANWQFDDFRIVQ